MLTLRQREMLLAFARDGEATDIADFWRGKSLDWFNRERVITSLRQRGLLDADGITEKGREVLGIKQ